MNAADIKEKDIFRWFYSAAQIERFKNSTRGVSDLYWAKSRYCIVRKHQTTGVLYLEDTFWGESGDNLIIPLDKIGVDYDLDYLGNFDELKQIDKWIVEYYNPEDILDISHSNSFDSQIYLKKGAKKTIEVIRAKLQAKIDKSRSDIRWTQRQIERDEEQLANLTEETIDKVSL